MTNYQYLHSEVWEEELLLQRQLELDYALDNSPQKYAPEKSEAMRSQEQLRSDISGTLRTNVESVLTLKEQTADIFTQKAIQSVEGVRGFIHHSSSYPGHIHHWYETRLGKKWRQEHGSL